MKKNIIIAVIVIVIAAGSFFGGMKYQQSKVAGSTSGNARNFGNLTQEQRQQLGRNGNGGPGGGMVSGGGFSSGEILSNDNKSITLKLVDGGSKIIFFSDSTEISKNATGTSADLVAGKTVMVSGTTNQDGSITAKTIQLRTLPAIPSGSPVPNRN
jgi:hypothetical protein